MAFGFYGLNMAQNPLYSRLFNPSVYGQAQQNYQTGMSQFTPYDARQAYASGQMNKQQPQQQEQAPQRVGMKPIKTYKDNGYLDERYANGLRVVTRPDGMKTVNLMSGSDGGFTINPKTGEFVRRSTVGGGAGGIDPRTLSLYNMLGL